MKPRDVRKTFKVLGEDIMKTKIFLSLITFIFILTAVGCSGAGMNPLAPINNPVDVNQGIADDEPEPQREPVSNRVLWGLWNLTFDPNTMEVVIVPERNAQAHFNVANMILPPACDDCFAIEVNSFDPVTHILDVDVTLRNPRPSVGMMCEASSTQTTTGTSSPIPMTGPTIGTSPVVRI